MRLNFIALLLLILSMSIGCSEEEKKPNWKAGLNDLKNGNAIFSFVFFDTPPDGTLTRFGIFKNNIGSPCDLYRPDANIDSETPFWYLSVKTGKTEPGTYEITPFFDDLKDRNKAQVLLNYVKNPKSADKYPAVGGTVKLIKAPSDSDEWHKGIKLKAIINAEFPELVLTSGECEGVAGPEGFEGGTCECKAPDGTVTTCELQKNQETCCIDLDGPRITFSAETTAEPCPWACHWLMDRSDLAQYCQELF